MMYQYRTSQQQMSDVIGFGMSLMFIGLMLGLVKSLITASLESEVQPSYLPQTGKEPEPLKKYGLWDSYLDPGAAYAGARKLRRQGWPVKVTERRTMHGIKYYVWMGRKKNRQTPEMLPQVTIEGGESIPRQYRYLAEWLQEPLPEYSLLVLPAVVTEAGERKIDAVLKQLKEGVDSIQGSDKFRLFLSTMAKFHEYSIGNLILIAIQKPDATRVAGFNTWKDLGRWVKKGEKGISILAPVLPPKLKPEETEEGKEEEEEKIELEPRPIYFKVVYVFDFSQTEGKPLPEFEVPVLTGEANEELSAKVMALAKAEGLTVSFEPRPYENPEIKGQYFGKSIWVRPEESQAQQLKTLLHEVGHYFSEGVFMIPRRDAETIAESAAFAVGAHFGFDTGVRSFPYVALWAQDKKVLEQNLGAVRRVATRMIEGIEGQSSRLAPLTLPATASKSFFAGQYGKGALA